MTFQNRRSNSSSTPSSSTDMYTSGMSTSSSSDSTRTSSSTNGDSGHGNGRHNDQPRLHQTDNHHDNHHVNHHDDDDLAWPTRSSYQPQPPESSPMSVSVSANTLVVPSDEEEDRRHRRRLNTTTTTTSTHQPHPLHQPKFNRTTNRQISGWGPSNTVPTPRTASTIQMVVKPKPATTTLVGHPQYPRSQPTPQHRQPQLQPPVHRPTTNRLQAHLSKMAQRTSIGTALAHPRRIPGMDPSAAVLMEGADPSTTVISATSTFVSPMTADITETEEDYQFQTIHHHGQHRQHGGSSTSVDETHSNPTRSYDQEDDSYHHPSHDQQDPAPPPPPLSSSKEEPPGRNHDDNAFWYPPDDTTNHQDHRGHEERSEPSAMTSPASPPRYQPSLDVYSPTRGTTTTTTMRTLAEDQQEQHQRRMLRDGDDDDDGNDHAIPAIHRRFDDPMGGARSSWDDDDHDDDGLSHSSPPAPREYFVERTSSSYPYPPDPPPTQLNVPSSFDEMEAIAALSPTAQKYFFYNNKNNTSNTATAGGVTTATKDTHNSPPPPIRHQDVLLDREPRHNRSSMDNVSSSFQPGVDHRRPIQFQELYWTTNHTTAPAMTRLDEDNEEEEKNASAGAGGTNSTDYPLTTPSQYQRQLSSSYSATLHQAYPMKRLLSAPVLAPRTMMMTAMSTMETTSSNILYRKSMSFDADPTTEMGLVHEPQQHQQQQQQLLSWRMDPRHSLSDWRIEAFDRSSKQFTTYNVHKVVLCVGSRACGYFARQQQQQQQVQNSSLPPPTVQLPLIRKACELLPQLLDFCYSTPNWRVTRETAVGLVFLATFLEQPQLKTMAMEFVYNDLSPDKTGGDDDRGANGLVGSVLHHYLAEAGYFDQDELVEYLLELTATHLLEMDSPSRLLAELSPSQFLAVVRQIPKRSSSRLSTLVVDYCISHRLELTLPFVETCACLCPILTTDTSLALLELYLTLGGGTEDGYHYHGHAGGDTTTSGIGLLHRCLKVLAEDSAALLVSPDTLPQLVNQILDVCPPLLGPWMRDMVQHAQKQGTEFQADLRNAWEQQSVMREELTETKRALEQVQGERQQLQRTLESTKQELRQQLDGWMSKSHRDSTEHSTRQAIWQEERDLWRVERQAWMEERGALEHELYRLKAQVARQRDMAEMSKRQRRQAAKSKDDITNPCEQVQSQGILHYLSNVGMPTNGEVSMQVSDDDSFSAELNTIGSDS